MTGRLLIGDVEARLSELPDASVDCCVTSPPYFGLRHYLPTDDPDKALEIGAEATPEEYVARLVRVFREVRRVLTPTGSLWVNLGDAHARTPGKGYKPKDLYGLPFMLAFALRADGWTWQSCSPWIKRNVMPESIRDRPCHAVEYLLQFGATERPWADMHAVLVPHLQKSLKRYESGLHKTKNPNATAAETRRYQVGLNDTDRMGDHVQPGGRHRRDSDPFMESLRALALGGEGLLVEDGDPLAFVVNPKPYKGAHYAAYPVDLVVPILRCPPKVCAACRAPSCACPEGTPTRPGVVLDPFIGSGTTAQAAVQEGRDWIGIDLDSRNEALVRGRCLGVGRQLDLLARR